MPMIVRVIVLTGAGDKAFCAGADLQPGKASLSIYPSQTSTMPICYAPRIKRRYRLSRESMARAWRAASDYYAWPTWRWPPITCNSAYPKSKLVCIPDAGVELVAASRAAALSARMVYDRRAIRCGGSTGAGLLNYSVAAVNWIAKSGMVDSRVADKSPIAIRRGKYAMRAIASMSFEESLAHMEGQIALLTMTGDAQEGLAAFNEKRKPKLDRKIAATIQV